MTEDQPVVRITLSSIFDELRALQTQVTTLRSDLPSHVSITKGKQEEYDARLENHGTRLATLDTRVTAVESAVAIINAGKKAHLPWPVIVGGVVSIITGAGSLIAVITVLGQISQLKN